MTTPVPSIADLAAAVADLDKLDDVDRIAAARRLAVSLPQHIAVHADQWTYDLSREIGNQTAAMRLGVTKSQIERAITRTGHRLRQAADAARGMGQALRNEK